MSRALRVLVIDDSVTDLELTQLAFESVDPPVDVTTCTSGAGALSDLLAGRVHPDVILLDVNMPCVNGFEVLEALHASPALRHIPVVILTTSTNAVDRERARALHASGYLEKPPSFTAFQQQAATLAQQWSARRPASP